MRTLRLAPLFVLVFVACGSPSTPPTTTPTGATTASASAAPSASAATSAAPTATAEPAAPPVATDDKMKALALQRVDMLAKGFVAAWEREQIDANGKSLGQKVCPAPQPQPAKLDPAKAVTVGDDAWSKDPGWSCLRFLPSEAHWFQYEIKVTGDTAATIVARRHDLEIDVQLTRAPKGDWKVAKPVEKKP